jgi:serpin B
MNKRQVVYAMLLPVALLCSACAVFVPDVKSVVDANNRFAFDFYAEFRSGRENLLFSPLSISSALALSYEGASGKTAEEIERVFHFPKDEKIRKNSFLGIYKWINSEHKSYQFAAANALWIDKGYPVRWDYVYLANKYYGAEVKNVDFTNNPDKAVSMINHWAEQQTKGRIKDVVHNIDKDTCLLITNAVYFKGRWDQLFEKRNTKKEDFRVNAGKNVKVEMMHRDGRYNYAETDKLQILEMLYQGKELSMIILLPKNDDLDSLGQSLNMDNLNIWRNALREEDVELSLPKFKFENTLMLSETLKDMGMPTAFLKYEADFEKIKTRLPIFSRSRKKDNPPYITEVRHKAFVEVNEEGTEAAAVTCVDYSPGYVPGMELKPRIFIFNADHPFIFLIQEKKTGNILFVGRVNNPIS